MGARAGRWPGYKRLRPARRALQTHLDAQGAGSVSESAPTAHRSHRTSHRTAPQVRAGPRRGALCSAAARRDSPRRPGAGAEGAAGPGGTWLPAAGRAPRRVRVPGAAPHGCPGPGSGAGLGAAARPALRYCPRGGPGPPLSSRPSANAAGVSQAKCATNQTSRRWRNSTRRS